ncbi:TonB-dependent receptor [Microbulbifer agarilyticus]
MKVTKINISKKTLSVVIASVIYAQDLYAQETGTQTGGVLEEVTVTAQKRAQSLQDVPLSVSAVSGEKLQESGISDLSDLSSYVPNFSVQKGSLGDSINIRGMQSGNQAGFEQSVGTFVNGIFRGRGPQSRFAFVDVERVEVLRGPQSTLFGKNTVAGALNITSAKPQEDFAATVSASYNNTIEESRYTGMVTGALSDTLRGRVFLLSGETAKGWVENAYYDQGAPLNDELMGRVALDWDATESTTVSAMYEASDFDLSAAHSLMKAGPLAAFGAVEGWDKSNIGNSGPIFDVGAEQKMLGNHSEFTLSSVTGFEQGDLTITFGQSDYEFTRETDADYSPLNALRFDEAESFDQTSLEVRFASAAGDKFDYIGGFYWQEQNLETDSLSYFNIPTLQAVLQGGCAAGVSQLGGDPSAIYVPGDTLATAASVAMGVPNAPAALVNSCGMAAGFTGVPAVGRYARLAQESETLGAFAQGTWHFTESLRGTVGFRYTSEEKSASQAVFASNLAFAGDKSASVNPIMIALTETVGEFSTHSFSPSDDGMRRKESSPTWLTNVQYDFNDDVMGYATASTGFKSGGFNSFYMASFDDVNQRYADSDDVSFNEEKAASFEVGFKTSLLDNSAEVNIALFHTSFEDLQVSIFSGNSTFQVNNAAEATSRGLEIDSRWAATDNLMLFASVGLVDFEYGSFRNQACTSDQFLQRREEIYGQALAAGNANGALGAALGYNNAMCAAEGINDMSGRTSENTPEVKAALALSHYTEFGGFELKSNLDLNYSSDVYRIADLDPVGMQDAMTVINAGLVLTPNSEKWSAGLIAKNITDERQLSFINDIPLFPGAHGFLPQPGRNWELQFNYHFGD